MKQNWKAAVWQFIKFNIVGILNTAVDFVVFFVLTHFNVGEMVAQCISYSCGIVNSYIWNSHWTFKAQHKRTAREFCLFVGINIVSLGVSLLALYVCREVVGIESELIRKGIATVLSALVNFTGNKLFVFRAAGEPGGGEEN